MSFFKKNEISTRNENEVIMPPLPPPTVVFRLNILLGLGLTSSNLFVALYVPTVTVVGGI